MDQRFTIEDELSTATVIN